MRRQVFIDTSEFVAANFDFHAKKFETLKSRVKSNQLTIGMTTIVRNEIRSQIGGEVDQAKRSIDKARREARILRNSTDVTSLALFADVDFESVKQALFANLEKFIEDAKVELLDTSFVDSEKIFKQYFEGKAPFATRDKKSEFPDAFNIAAVNAWADDARGRTLVVSSDHGVRAAVGDFEKLEFVDSVEHLLDKISHEFDRLAPEATQALESVSPLIEDTLREEITRLKLVMTNWPGAVTLREVSEVRIDPSLLSVNQEAGGFVNAEFDVYISADLEVLFEYEDLDASSALKAHTGNFDFPTKFLESRTNVFWATPLTLRFDHARPTEDVNFFSHWNIFGEIEILFDGSALSDHQSTGRLVSPTL